MSKCKCDKKCSKKKPLNPMAVLMYFISVLIMIAGVIDIAHNHLFWGVIFLAGGMAGMFLAADTLE